jgi:hypothetical protein
MWARRAFTPVLSTGYGAHDFCPRGETEPRAFAHPTALDLCPGVVRSHDAERAMLRHRSWRLLFLEIRATSRKRFRALRSGPSSAPPRAGQRPLTFPDWSLGHAQGAWRERRRSSVAPSPVSARIDARDFRNVPHPRRPSNDHKTLRSPGGAERNPGSATGVVRSHDAERAMSRHCS